MRHLTAASMFVAASVGLSACGGGGGDGGDGGLVRPVPTGPETTPVPVTILGTVINVVHLEQTDFVTHLTGRSGVRYNLPATEGDITLPLRGTVHNEITCPGTKNDGNTCTITEYNVNGTIYTPRPEHQAKGERADYSIGVHLRGFITRLQPAGSLHGVEMYRTQGTGPQGHHLTTNYGGWGDHYGFYAVGPNPIDPRANHDAFSSFGVAFGALSTGRPQELEGGATWRGAMVGRTIDEAVEVNGKSTVSYNFSNNSVDVMLSEIAGVPGHGTYSGTSKLMWMGVRVNGDASFYIPGHGNDNTASDPHSALGYIDGDFYGPTHQGVAGVFEKDNLVGAFGGDRDSN